MATFNKRYHLGSLYLKENIKNKKRAVLVTSTVDCEVLGSLYKLFEKLEADNDKFFNYFVVERLEDTKLLFQASELSSSTPHLSVPASGPVWNALI